MSQPLFREVLNFSRNTEVALSHCLVERPTCSGHPAHTQVNHNVFFTVAGLVLLLGVRSLVPRSQDIDARALVMWLGVVV